MPIGSDRRVRAEGDARRRPVMTAKFLVPVLNAPVLDRPRLVHRLTAAAAARSPWSARRQGRARPCWRVRGSRPARRPAPSDGSAWTRRTIVPGVFWTYLLTGLERAGVDLTGVGMPDGRRTASTIRCSCGWRLGSRSDPTPIVLVLDNAETITRQRIFDELDFLVRHAAGGLRLVLLTRVDPGLPLPQYRLEGALSEIGFSDLAFRPDEAA